MKLINKNMLPNITMGAGFVISGIGGFIFFTADMGSRLFAISQEIFGAGLFVILGGWVAKILKKK